MGNIRGSRHQQEGRTMTIWDILHALSGLDDYVGQINRKRELVIKPKSELTPSDIVIGK